MVANKRPVVVASQFVASRTHFVFLLLLRLPLLHSVIAIVVAERSISLLFAPDSTAAELLDVISFFLVQFCFFFFWGVGEDLLFFVVSVSCMAPISL